VPLNTLPPPPPPLATLPPPPQINMASLPPPPTSSSGFSEEDRLRGLTYLELPPPPGRFFSPMSKRCVFVSSLKLELTSEELNFTEDFVAIKEGEMSPTTHHELPPDFSDLPSPDELLPPPDFAPPPPQRHK
jgi:hypothetical protein